MLLDAGCVGWMAAGGGGGGVGGFALRGLRKYMIMSLENDIPIRFFIIRRKIYKDTNLAYT